MDSPIVLCGLGRVGWRVLECLRSSGFPVVAVDTVADPADPRLAGVRLVRGDCRNADILREAGIVEARGAIIATSDDLVNISSALMVRRTAPKVRIVLRMFNQNLVARLGKAVPNVTALSVSALAAPLLALTATTGELIAAFAVGDGRRQVFEFHVPADSPLHGKPLHRFDESGRCLVLAHSSRARPPRLLLDLEPDAPIATGDRLVVMARPGDFQRLLNHDSDDLSDVLWAGRIRRFSRVAYRTLSQMDLAVKVCAATLLVVVTTSTTIYHFGLGYGWANSLYHTISVVSTGADLGGQQYEGWGQVFVSGLKMFGTILVAAFTAIFTNFLLRARLGGALEVRRIPDSGHMVVIGLGNVGYRVVEELVHQGEQVVVVEQKADSPFIPTCRRTGVPVIVGDATIRETLLQARVKEARAVIAATSSDLVNLEVALLVAELNEQQRVVVRLGDSVLAETARTAAGVKMAVSLPELAAPAFLAGLLGDRVLSLFEVEGHVLAVVEITVQPEDRRLTENSLQSVAIDYGIVPVGLLDADRKERTLNLENRLQEGERLIAVSTVPNLDRIMRRVAIPATWSVEVQSFPLSAREALVLRVRALRHLSAEEADALVDKLPFVMAAGQTRGQAQELLAILQREKINGQIFDASRPK